MANKTTGKRIDNSAVDADVLERRKKMAAYQKKYRETHKEYLLIKQKKYQREAVQKKYSLGFDGYVPYITRKVIKKYKFDLSGQKEWRNKKFPATADPEKFVFRVTSFFIHNYVKNRADALDKKTLNKLISDIANYLAVFTVQGLPAKQRKNPKFIAVATDVWRDKLINIAFPVLPEKDKVRKKVGRKPLVAPKVEHSTALQNVLDAGQRWITGLARQPEHTEPAEPRSYAEITEELRFVSDAIGVMDSVPDIVPEPQNDKNYEKRLKWQREYRAKNKERINKIWRKWNKNNLQNRRKSNVSFTVVSRLQKTKE